MPASPGMPSFAQVRSALLKAGMLPNGNHHKMTPPLDVDGHPEPAPIEPHMEGRPRYVPYLGTEMHGVDPGVPVADDAEGYGDGTVAVHYVDEPDEHVLPVRIVPQSEAETMTAWRASQSVAPIVGDRPPVQILPRNRKRTKAKVQNIATGDGVWIGPDSQVSSSNGYYLKPGDSVDLGTTEEVFAVSSTANAVPLAILVEYSKSA